MFALIIPNNITIICRCMEYDLVLLQGGDEKEFRRIVSDFWVRLYKFASIYTMDDEVAKEITQDTLMSLWNSKEKLLDNTNIGTYLSVINRNKCLDHLRKKQIEHLSIDDCGGDAIYTDVNINSLSSSSLDLLISKDLEKAFQDTINKLPEKTRDIFLLSRHEGLKNKAIADQLNISIKTVEFHLNKSVIFLRKELMSEILSILVLINLRCL